MNKIIKSALITFICCILIIFIKNEFSYTLLINSTYGMPALIELEEIENLYIGSSMFRQGLDIMTFENNIPNKNYILAYNGNQPALEYYQLSHLLTNNVKIDHLYIDMYVYSAWEPPELNDEKLLLEISLKEKWNLWKLIYNENKSQANYESFFRMFISSNNELLLTWPLISPIINSQFYRGGTLTSPPSADENVLAHTSAPIIAPDMNDAQKHYLQQIIQLAQSYNISITFIETPKYITVASDNSYLSAMEKYIQFANDENIPYIISENTAHFITNIGPDSSWYSFNHENADYFMDSIHLSYNGRVEFTEIITRRLYNYCLMK